MPFFHVGYMVYAESVDRVELACGSIHCKSEKGLVDAIKETVRSLKKEICMWEALGNRVCFSFWKVGDE